MIAHYIESNKKSQRYYQDRADVMKIAEIIEKYHQAYGEYLIVKRNIDGQSGSILMAVLAAVHTPSGHPYYPEVIEHNTRMINFAESITGRHTINNMMVDPWDESYHIGIDPNRDGIVEFVWKTFTHDYKPINDLVLRIYRPVIAWSNGPDKRNNLGFGDDICSWHNY